MEFSEIVKKRYATKKFTGEKITQDKIDALLEIIRHAASSFNIQPWRIKVISDGKTKELLSPVSWNQPQVTSCSHLLVFCADTDIKGKIDMLEKMMPGAADYINMMRGFEKGMDDEKKLAWAQRQLYLALGNAINGAKSLGFDSCPMEGFNPQEYSRLLKLPDNIVPTALCAVGYAADSPGPKQRFAKKDVFF